MGYARRSSVTVLGIIWPLMGNGTHSNCRFFTGNAQRRREELIFFPSAFPASLRLCEKFLRGKFYFCKISLTKRNRNINLACYNPCTRTVLIRISKYCVFVWEYFSGICIGEVPAFIQRIQQESVFFSCKKLFLRIYF